MRQQGRRGSDSNFYGQSGGVWPARLGHRVPPLPDTPTPALANGNHTPAGAAVVKRKFHTAPGDWKARDAYFTRPRIARQVWGLALRHCRAEGLDPGELHWIEPAAGAGVFLATRPACVRHITAMGIEPMAAGIAEGDFLEGGGFETDGKPLAVVGNPPFGSQQDMTPRFLQHAFRQLRAGFAVFITSGNYPPLTRQRRRLAGIRAGRAIRIDGGGAAGVGSLATFIAVPSRRFHRPKL